MKLDVSFLFSNPVRAILEKVLFKCTFDIFQIIRNFLIFKPCKQPFFIGKILGIIHSSLTFAKFTWPSNHTEMESRHHNIKCNIGAVSQFLVISWDLLLFQVDNSKANQLFFSSVSWRLTGELQSKAMFGSKIFLI